MNTFSPMNRPAVFVVGTRAQLIKVAPVIKVCESSTIDVRLVMTGQHQETIAELLREFDLKTIPERLIAPKERASVWTLLTWTPMALVALVKKLRSVRTELGKPEVLIHGDTLSTLLSAMAARLSGCRILHLESGLTSNRLFNPFPEELIRRIVFSFCDVAFCPDAASVTVMVKRGCAEVIDTAGNTIVDAVRMVASSDDFTRSAPDQGHVVVSLHRFQNIFDSARLRYLMKIVSEIAEQKKVYFVLHPATKKKLKAAGYLELLQEKPSLILSPRLEYGAFLKLMWRADCVLSDGGSNQEELAAMGVPTIVMRETSERIDGLGRNAIMESDVPGGVVSYVLGGQCAELRRDPSYMNGESPSFVIRRYLEGNVRYRAPNM